MLRCPAFLHECWGSNSSLRFVWQALYQLSHLLGLFSLCGYCWQIVHCGALVKFFACQLIKTGLFSFNHCGWGYCAQPCSGFVWMYVLISLGCRPRSGIARSYGNCVFNLVRNCPNVFQTGLTSLCSQQQHKWGPISSYLLECFLTSAFLVAVELYLTVVCLFI